MRLSKRAIKEFKEIYYREFGSIISDEEAQEKGQSLLSLFKIIYRSIPADEINNLKKHRKKES